MARLRWRLFFESVWSPEIPQVVDTSMPSHLKGRERIEFAKNKERAADLLTSLFPADEEADG